jgi:hypothetical protein
MESSPLRHLSVVEHIGLLEVTSISVFGPVGVMDEDGFSGSYSFAEKATIERSHLASIDERIDEARAAGQYNVVMAGEAYREDLRARIDGFDALAGVTAATANESHTGALKAA